MHETGQWRSSQPRVNVCAEGTTGTTGQRHTGAGAVCVSRHTYDYGRLGAALRTLCLVLCRQTERRNGGGHFYRGATDSEGKSG